MLPPLLPQTAGLGRGAVGGFIASEAFLALEWMAGSLGKWCWNRNTSWPRRGEGVKSSARHNETRGQALSADLFCCWPAFDPCLNPVAVFVSRPLLDQVNRYHHHRSPCLSGVLTCRHTGKDAPHKYSQIVLSSENTVDKCGLVPLRPSRSRQTYCSPSHPHRTF